VEYYLMGENTSNVDSFTFSTRAEARYKKY
jgi:hypothetical protein